MQLGSLQHDYADSKIDRPSSSDTEQGHLHHMVSRMEERTPRWAPVTCIAWRPMQETSSNLPDHEGTGNIRECAAAKCGVTRCGSSCHPTGAGQAICSKQSCWEVSFTTSTPRREKARAAGDFLFELAGTNYTQSITVTGADTSCCFLGIETGMLQ